MCKIDIQSKASSPVVSQFVGLFLYRLGNMASLFCAVKIIVNKLILNTGKLIRLPEQRLLEDVPPPAFF
jgi:hypothetical protein